MPAGEQQPPHLRAAIIGQLSLMQSMLVALPDKKSIFSFMCHGLRDLPGVSSVRYADTTLQLTDPSLAAFPLVANHISHGALLFTLSDPQAFFPYKEYLANFCIMMAVVLEERDLRHENEMAKINLEARIRERTMELELKSDEANKANLAKDLFIATLSHELRTPLTAILSWAQLIKSGRLDAGKSQRGIKAIEESALAQSRLVDDLLDISGIATGKLSLHCSDFSPAEIIGSEIEAIASAAAQKKIELSQDLDPEAKTAFADPARLHQILWNLLGNALKFTPPGGKIWITLRKDSNRVWFIIRDSGIGIAPEFIDHIFDRFSQADSSSTRRHGGLGLGLAISSSLIRIMGGKIKVESPGEGKGTSFSFYLPTRAVALRPDDSLARQSGIRLAPLQQSTQEALNRIKGTKILYIDDDSAALEAVTMLLESYGTVVRTAASATAAIQVRGSFTPDLIISDLAMPEQDGYDLLKRIRCLPSEKDKPTPVIALSAYAGVGDIKRVAEAGFQGHLAKPVDTNVLLQTIVTFKKRRLN